MRSALVITIVAVCACAALRVSAQASVPNAAQGFSWTAPSECPDAAAMQARIARMLARSAAAARAPAAKGKVERRGAQYLLTLELEVNERVVTRTLSAQDCASVSEAAAWLVALAIDPALPAEAREEGLDTGVGAAPVPSAANSAGATGEHAADDGQPAEAKAPNAPAAKQSAKDEDSAARDEDARSSADERENEEHAQGRALRLQAALFGGMLAAGLAGPAASFGLQLGATHAGFVAQLSLALELQRTRQLSGGGTSDFSSQWLGIDLCRLWGHTIRLGPCLDLALLRAHGEARGTARPGDAELWSGYAGASLAAHQALGERFDLWLDAGLFVPISARPEFRIAGIGSVGRASFVLGSLRLGFGVLLP